MSNSIHVIEPYLCGAALVFDDEGRGLVKEPFVGGADTALAVLASNAAPGWEKKGFTLLFSDKPFAGHQTRFDWLREEYDGNVYFSEELKFEGWLCPALLKYFSAAPKTIYIEIRKRNW